MLERARALTRDLGALEQGAVIRLNLVKRVRADADRAIADVTAALSLIEGTPARDLLDAGAQHFSQPNLGALRCAYRSTSAWG